jgi:acyl-CoA thioester hydrolase
MSKPLFPTPIEVEQLTCCLRETINTAYLDAMGHMNVRHYLALFDDATWKFFADLGLDDAYYATQNGAFALQQFISYRAEVVAGEKVAVYPRLLGRSSRKVHYILFMINESRGNLAAALEEVGAHADLIRRRTSPFPPPIAATIDSLLATHERLSWPAPLCGAIRA